MTGRGAAQHAVRLMIET